MTSALRYRNAWLIIPNPNLAFALQYTNKHDTTQNEKAAIENISQNSQLNHKPEKDTEKDESSETTELVTEFPEAPTTCCMSGCANCVWLDYAEKISAYYKDGGEQAIKEINEKVDDANVRAFLLHELRMRQKES